MHRATKKKLDCDTVEKVQLENASKRKKTNKETNCNPVYILQIYILQILRKYDMNTLQIYPPHLSDVATLPWEIQKVIFHHYYLYTPNYCAKCKNTVQMALDCITVCFLRGKVNNLEYINNNGEK